MTTARDRTALMTLARTQTRDLRLSQAYRAELGDELDKVLVTAVQRQDVLCPAVQEGRHPGVQRDSQQY